MAKQRVLIGQTDYTVLVMMRDDAGAPATALAHTDIDIAYARVETDNDVTTADVAPADLANLTAAHTDWGWEVVSATDHPGLYRLDIADAVFASGAWSAVVSVTGTGLDPAHLEFELVAVDDRDGTPTVNVTEWNGSAVATPTVAGVPEVDMTHAGGAAITGTGTPEVILSAAGLAAVNAEVVDCLNVDTYAEIGQETPAATQTIRKMLGFAYKAWRNKKTSDGTTEKLFNDDAATVDQKRTVSEAGGTVTKGEVATGP